MRIMGFPFRLVLTGDGHGVRIVVSRRSPSQAPSASPQRVPGVSYVAASPVPTSNCGGDRLPTAAA
jgi:hypothetical protein